MEFDLPWRIHWQVPDPPDETVLGAIRDCRPLALTLQVVRAAGLSALGLPWEGTLAVVIVDGWREHGVGASAGTAGRWEFPVSDPEEARALAEKEFFGLEPGTVSLRWFPRRGSLADLLPLLESAGAAGVGLTLPNRPAGVITSEGEGAFPGPEELAGQIRQRLASAAGKVPGGRLIVHDFLLTQALGLKGPEPEGCEAANSMAFIDGQGSVYPCQTLLVRMGDLHRNSMEAIWASPVRKRIRRDVESLPGQCAGCGVLSLCRGGCRGAVYHLAGHYGAPDPLCPGTGPGGDPRGGRCRAQG